MEYEPFHGTITSSLQHLAKKKKGFALSIGIWLAFYRSKSK
jgi:hypothetical protein